MLLRLKNRLYTYAPIIILLMQLFSSLPTSNGFEQPLELLRQDVNGPKSMDYARRIEFPLTSSNGGVEFPLNVDDNTDLNSSTGNGLDGVEGDGDVEDNNKPDDDLRMKEEMPKWLQMRMHQELHHNSNHHSTVQPKYKHSNKHHHDNSQVHASLLSSAAASPLRRCSIEISQKIHGICQLMGSIGNACVSGDYIDVFNAACL